MTNWQPRVDRIMAYPSDADEDIGPGCLDLLANYQ
jgi:hypothetical protein